MWIAPGLPRYSIVNKIATIQNHVLIRPYHFEGLRPSGIYVSRNPKRPRIWAHILAVPYETSIENPLLKPGAFVTYRRYSSEYLAFDPPAREEYPGQILPVHIVHINSLDAVIDPAPVDLVI